jgi:hypothetical protein
MWNSKVSVKIGGAFTKVDGPRIKIRKSGAFQNALPSGAYPSSWLDWVKDNDGVSFWQLNDASNATVAADSVGTNPGTYMTGRGIEAEGATSFDAGIAYGAMNGIFTYVTVPSSPELNANRGAGSELSVEFWVKIPANYDVTTFRRLVIKDNDWYFFLGTDRRLYCGYSNMEWGTANMPLIPLDAWTHVMWTWKKGATAYLYINGVQVKSGAAQDPPAASTNQLFIGYPYPSNNYPPESILDDVAVYSVALTPQKVAERYSLSFGESEASQFTLYGWGSNSSGRTALGTSVGNTASPTQSGSFTDWTVLDFASEANGLGIRNGLLYQWGDGTLTPTQVGSDSGWSFVSAGTTHSLAIRNGELYAWGLNNSGRTGLGISDLTTTASPTRVGSFNDWTWVSAGLDHSLGIRDGKLYAWGNNANGKTGLGITSGSTTTPTQVGTATGWSICDAGRSSHSLALRDGKIFAFGANAAGQTGLGTATGNQTTPAQVGTDADWTWIACDAGVSAAIRGGQLYTWGDNSSGVTAQGTNSGILNVPTQVGTGSDWETVSVSFTHALGIREGQLYAWGSNASNATGLGTTSGLQTTPAQVGSATDWVQARAGRSASMGGRAS